MRPHLIGLAIAAVTITLTAQAQDTYVLIAGTLGGAAGMARLRARLTSEGQRVIVLDPFRQFADSLDITYVAMARRVAVLLHAEHIEHAHVVAHSQSTGIALRLAASCGPPLVSDIVLLEGVGSEYQSDNMSLAVRVAPYIARVSAGRSLIRRYLGGELRTHSGRLEWLDDATERAYLDPIVAHIEVATAMLRRMAATRQPDSLRVVYSRVHVPVTLVVGLFPHSSAPDSVDQALLEGSMAVKVVRLEGVGHFPHEEDPEGVARILRAGRKRPRLGAGV